MTHSERTARAIQARAELARTELKGLPYCGWELRETGLKSFIEGCEACARIAREMPAWVDVDDAPPAEGRLVLARSEITGHPSLATWDVGNLCFRDEEGCIIPGRYWAEIPEGPDHAR